MSPVRKQPIAPRAFGSVAEADRVFTAAARPWAEALTPDERGVLDDYKGDLGWAINAVLRGDATVPGLGGRAATLARAVARAECPEDVRLYRGVGEDEAATLRAAEAGAVMSRPAFMSTTLSRRVARKLGRKVPFLVEVLVRRGTRGAAYVHPFPSERFRQYEMLLRPGMAMRVVSVGAAGIVLEALDGPDGDDY